MAVTRVQFAFSKTYSVTANQTANTSPTLATPATAGNLLIYAVAIDKSAGTINTPAGWTPIAVQTGTSISLAVFGKPATGGETTVSPVTWSTAVGGWAAVLAEYSGTPTTGWLGGVHLPAYSDVAGASIALDPPASTAGPGRCLAFFAMDTADVGSTFSPSGTGFTLVQTVAGDTAPTTPSGQPGLAFEEYAAGLTSGQDVPSTTFTWTNSDQVIGTAFVVYEGSTAQNYTANPADGAGAVDSLPLLPPDGLTVTPASTTQLDLRWALTAGADAGYDIERDGAVIVTGRTVPTYSDTGLTPATSHSYRVRSARNVSG